MWWLFMPWMGFGRGGRWGWVGPYPGRGPWSHLPPWMRPGWIWGKGACWWLFGLPYWIMRAWYPPPIVPWYAIWRYPIPWYPYYPYPW
ncbi:MAG TPA: hypothetical protein EYH02_00660 [Ignisphaera aggregans]|uniref:Uncharacterized protein n=1 Tax=Ignisphaera aggregans TaxID=334771 RepID=A0A832Z239_9CREN|nr:hypothetical protein [Ignisphaera aggregans]